MDEPTAEHDWGQPLGPEHEQPRTSDRSPRRTPSPRSAPSAPSTLAGRSFGAAIGFTVLGTIVPGLGLVAAGKRRAGAIVLAVTGLLLLLVGWFALFRRSDLLHLAVDPTALSWLSPLLFALGMAWVAVIVTSYRALRPWRISPLGRFAGSALVSALAIVVMLPMAFTSRVATVQGDLVSTVFKDDKEIRSETKPQNVTAEDPWGGRDRVNVLLLGSDSGKGRTTTRTDTVMVASIDTRTGATALFSLPRNLEQVPFPPGSKLAKAYPDGIFDPGRKFRSTEEELEYMLNAMYNNVPEQNPGLLKSDNPGADVLKMAVGESLGLELHYYVMINLDGFEALIDALGGITVNVNYPVPIGGDASRGIRPSGYIQPGPNQHLTGSRALWFARGRYGLNDYKRMQRQRCVMQAIVKQANPSQVLQKYEGIANASKKIVRTDIPRGLLPAFVDLSMKVKDAKISSVVFDTSVIEKTYRPDYDLIRARVRQAIASSTRPSSPPEPTNVPDPAGSPESSSDPDDDGSEGSGGSDDSEDSGSRSGNGGSKKKEQSMEQSCGYHPEQQ
ncbi:MAG TPA: LCP family protein [Actinopolymorphaceae bacterium]